MPAFHIRLNDACSSFQSVFKIDSYFLMALWDADEKSDRRVRNLEVRMFDGDDVELVLMALGEGAVHQGR